jgi:hypothetical protein
MTWVSAAVDFLGPTGTALVGSSALNLLGGSMQANAAQQAAQTQLQGTQYAADIQKQMFDTLNAQQAPYRAAGQTALTQIQNMLPYFTGQPTAQDIQNIPGYQFGLNQGLGSVSQAANVASPGSNVDTARQKFSTDYLTQQLLPYYQSQQTNIYNRLASLAGLGQTAATSSGQVGQAAGSNLAQLAVGGANAVAGGQVGSANAIASGLGNIGNSAMLYSLLRPQTATTTSAIDPSLLPG